MDVMLSIFPSPKDPTSLVQERSSPSPDDKTFQINETKRLELTMEIFFEISDKPEDLNGSGRRTQISH